MDVGSNLTHCGTCDNACAGGQSCNTGTCSCPAGTSFCDGQCVSTTDNVLHCGACNNECTGGRTCTGTSCTCTAGLDFCGGACTDTSTDAAHCGSCNNDCGGAACSGGQCESNTGGTGGGGTGGAATGGAATGGVATGGAATGGSPGSCEPGSTTTEWATSCRTTPASCTAGTWTARSTGSDGHPLRYESEHFALYWFTSDPDGSGPLLGLSSPPSQTVIDNAFNTLEAIWDGYFGSPVFFPEPYCNSSTKTKAAVHLDDYYPLWGGGWGSGYMGLWVGVGALQDNWGLAHEFNHGVQSTTQAFPDCGGVGCWVFESHANWMPHQLYRNNVHCSEMLPNMPHLYYGNTRDRYCNWQFFEFVKDKHCYEAVNEMWSYSAPSGQRDPWQKLMLSQGWSIEDLNDLFGEWAMHNVTWDYRNPPPTSGNDQGTVYRQSYGSIEDTSRNERRLRLTRLEALDASWATNRRFVSPYYWAPQRWGYNTVRLYPEASASSVHVTFRGVTQSGANSGWRWGLVATNSSLTTARYSPLQEGTDAELDFCVNAGENLYLVVVATPTQYQKITWTNPSDGPAYPSIYRYPYMIEVDGAWPAGFQNGALDACPSGTQRHANGNGCAPAGTAASVYVGPYARILSGTVSGNARIEDQATVIRGTVSGNARVGAMSLIAGQNNGSFNVSDSAIVQGTFYPLGWFGGGSVSGTARLMGDLEYYTAKSSNTFYGLVDAGWSGVSSVTEVTTAPPYTWRP